MTSALKWAVVAALLVALSACGPSADVQQMQDNESALRSMVANDRQQIDALQEKIARQNDRLTELEHGGAKDDSAATAVQDRLTKLETQMAAMQSAQSASNPTGAPGPNAPEIASATPPETTPPSAQPPTGKAPSWQEAVNRESSAGQNDPGAKLYRAGLADMKAAKYQSALGKFQDMQRRYPKSSLSGAAEYFSGNALFELGQYEKAILQFNDLVSRFPDGKYTTAALLREAQAFLKINDQIDARLTLQKLINDHPNSPETPEAKSLMSLSS